MGNGISLMVNMKYRLLVRGFWAICSMITVYLCFWLIPSVFWTLNAKAVDRLFVFRSHMESLKPSYDDTIVHVDLNDSSIQELDNYYLNRSHFAQVVKNLSAMDVAAQVFDFIFAVKTSNEDDGELIDAAADAGSAYFGMAFELGKGAEAGKERETKVKQSFIDKTLWRIPVEGGKNELIMGLRPLFTYSDLAQASAGIGFINVKPGGDFGHCIQFADKY